MQQYMFSEKNLVNLKEASDWATRYLNRNITTANISYLLQYGVITKHGGNGRILINVEELKGYYQSHDKHEEWKKKLGDDLNWHLSFVEYPESERTKHVHRLHPYKGKFIPQLVEYFLDSHTDEFKREAYFRQGDIVLDPFCGSGTTLVQGNELGMHAIGIDISAFNALISNAKVCQHDLPTLTKEIHRMTCALDDFQKTKNNQVFEQCLMAKLAEFNAKHFPSPEYKIKVRQGHIDEPSYARDKAHAFAKVYADLVKKHGLTVAQDTRHQDDSFMGKWFLSPVREEIDCLFGALKKTQSQQLKRMLAIILSRTVRSCRATTHADLGTLKEPVTATYYCKKHGKICKPIFSTNGWWQRYSVDTVHRLREFDALRTDTFQACLTGNSGTIDIFEEVKSGLPARSPFLKLLPKQKIRGIFSSPPYVGLINYHEQHAYSYEIFGFARNDDAEIGPLSKGQGRQARHAYVKGIADTLNNCKKYLQEGYDVFLVANDKYNLYPDIAELSGMKIVNQFKRPVLNRVEKDRAGAYSEIIFHLREK